MLNEFIEKILVHERDRKGSIQTTQEVEIYFNFVGRFVPPAFGEVELTPEELEEIRKREERKDTQKVFLCLDSDTAGSEACTRLAQDIPGEIAVIRLVPARKDWNDVLRQQGDIPSRKFIAETITLRELPTAQPVPMLRMADVELTSVDWLWFP